MTGPGAVPDHAPDDRPRARDALVPVAAVVPLHRPGPDVADLVRSLAPQVAGRVVVVDDTGDPGDPDDSAPGGDPVREALLAGLEEAGALVVRHPRNAGIAAALTTGVGAVRERWPDTRSVLTVDQDSGLADDHVVRLLAAADAAAAAGARPGLVGPAEVEGLPTRAARRPEPGAPAAPGREPVQSGLLVPLAVWDEVGGVDVGLVIDGVDSDLWLKVLDTGRVVVVAPGLRVAHRLGTGHRLRVGGRRLTLSVSAPFRSYYLVRNRLRLVARHGRRHPGWALGQLLGLARHLAVVLLLDPSGRRERVVAAGAGLRDALLGREGPRPRSRR